MDITPQAPVPLFGRGGRSSMVEAIAIRLEANVILIEGSTGFIALVGLDTLFPSRALKEAVLRQIAEDSRPALQELVLISTHTHNAPALDGSKPLLGKIDKKYFDLVSSRVAVLLSHSLKTRGTSTRIFRGQGACSLNASRRRAGLRLSKTPPFLKWEINLCPAHHSEVPREIQLLIARDQTNAPIWVLWLWNCHATSSPNSPLAISADFPGAVREIIRNYLKMPSLPVLFMPGFCGDLRPDPSMFPIHWVNLFRTPFQRPFASATRKNFSTLTTRLGTEMLNIIRTVSEDQNTATLSVSSHHIPLMKIMENDNSQDTISMIHMRGGSLSFFFVGAEVCSPYLDKIAPLFPSNTLCSGYAEAVPCYLPDDRQIAQKGYEVEGFLTLFARKGRFKSSIEQHILATAEMCSDDLNPARTQVT